MSCFEDKMLGKAAEAAGVIAVPKFVHQKCWGVNAISLNPKLKVLDYFIKKFSEV